MHAYPYGTVLKIRREDEEAEIRRQLTLIQRLGFNTVVVWPPVYWWESPETEGYPFATGRRLLEIAERLGLGVVLELVGQIPNLEYAPGPVMKPEYRAIERDGSPRDAARPYDFINYNHPAVQELMRGYFTDIVEAYRGYRSLVGYDLWNETMFTSFDSHTLELFHRWLEEKYTTLERLNEAWNHGYDEWTQIRFEQWSWGSVMPVVDYEQFHKANVALILQRWRRLLFELDPSRPCIADNIHSATTADAHYDRPQDDWSVAEEVDIFGISFYPKNHLPEMPPYERWEIFSAVRGAAGGRGFWVSEMQSHNQSMFNPFNIVRPKDLLFWNWEAVSNGAKGIIYWKWRPFLRGIQTAARGLVDSRGELTERAEAAGRIAGFIGSRSEELLRASPRPARAAVLYDSLCHDFVKVFAGSYEPVLSGSLYTDSIAGLAHALWENNVAVDFVVPSELSEGGIDGYRVLFVTSQVNLGRPLAAQLLRYVEQGGTIVYDGKFGLIDDSGLLNPRQPGGPLNDRLGIRQVDVEPRGLDFLVDDEKLGRFALSGYHERELCVLDDSRATIAGSYSDGTPAIIRSRVGAGEFIGVSTFLWYGYRQAPSAATDHLVGRLDDIYALSSEKVGSKSLKTKVLASADRWYLFVFNYGNEMEKEEVRIRDMPWQRSRIERVEPPMSGGATRPVVAERTREGEIGVPVEIGPLSVAIYELVPAS